MVDSRSPSWASRISREKIARIYRDDAAGIHDEGLIDEVYFGLVERCRSILAVSEARKGRAICPACDSIVPHDCRRDSQLACDGCGWTTSWRAYRGSFQGEHLIAPGMEPFYREFLSRVRVHETPRERMLRIDWLIHRVHWEGTSLPGQPGANTLISGRATEVNAFLHQLSAGEYLTRRLTDPSSYWTGDQLRQVSKWRGRMERRTESKRRA